MGIADTDHKDVIITQPSNANARDGNDETTTRTDNSISNQADGECSSDIGSTSGELQNERPMSPGMLALMCDENDTTFALESEKRVQGLDKASGFDSELHAKQEKVVLTRFRDFLNHLVVCASVKESMHNNDNAQNQQIRALNGNNNITRPQLLISNLNCSNGTVRPQFPPINHSSSNSFIKPQLPTSNQHVSNVIVMSDAPKTKQITDHSIVRPQLHGLDDRQQPSTK